jgi:hypothetical protein
MSVKVDGSKVRIFGTRRAAQDGARAIGWPMSSVVAVSTRFQECWALGTGIDLDPYTGLAYLSRERYGEIHAARNTAPGESFCACGRVVSQCDGSRAGCHAA